MPAAVTVVAAAAGPHVDVRVGFAGQRDRHIPVHRDDRRRDPGEGVRDPAAEAGGGGGEEEGTQCRAE